MNKDSLANIGSASISISRADHFGDAPSPTAFPNQQTFTEPIQLAWQAMDSDPGSGGSLYTDGNGVYLRLNKNTHSPPKLTTKPGTKCCEGEPPSKPSTIRDLQRHRQRQRPSWQRGILRSV